MPTARRAVVSGSIFYLISFNLCIIFSNGFIMAEMGLGYGSEFQLLRFLGHHRNELNEI